MYDAGVNWPPAIAYKDIPEPSPGGTVETITVLLRLEIAHTPSFGHKKPLIWVRADVPKPVPNSVKIPPPAVAKPEEDDIVVMAGAEYENRAAGDTRLPSVTMT